MCPESSYTIPPGPVLATAATAIVFLPSHLAPLLRLPAIIVLPLTKEPTNPLPTPRARTLRAEVVSGGSCIERWIISRGVVRRICDLVSCPGLCFQSLLPPDRDL